MHLSAAPTPGQQKEVLAVMSVGPSLHLLFFQRDKNSSPRVNLEGLNSVWNINLAKQEARNFTDPVFTLML